jgi:hypothetical protein
MHDFTVMIFMHSLKVGMNNDGVKGEKPPHMVCTRVLLYQHYGFYKVPKVINRLVVIIRLRDYSRSNNIRKTISFGCSLA